MHVFICLHSQNMKSKLAENSSKVTGLLIVNFMWFMALVLNEIRQCVLARKNGDAYWTRGITGNKVDIISYVFLLIAFVIHIAALSHYDDGDSPGMDYPVIYPNLYPKAYYDHLERFCPFTLNQSLIFAQAYFSINSKASHHFHPLRLHSESVNLAFTYFYL